MQFNTTDSLKDLRAYCTENNIDVSGNKRAKQSYLNAIYYWQSRLKPVLPVNRKYLKISNRVEADITNLEQYETGLNYILSLIDQDPDITVINVKRDESGIIPTGELTVDYLNGSENTIECDHVFLYPTFVNPIHSEKLTTDICDELEANNIDDYWLNEFRHGTTSAKYVHELCNEYGYDSDLADITWRLLFLNRAISAYKNYQDVSSNGYADIAFFSTDYCYPDTFRPSPYSVLYLKKYFEKNTGRLEELWFEVAKECWKPSFTWGQVSNNPNLLKTPTYTKGFNSNYDKRILAKQLTVKDILENPHLIAKDIEGFRLEQKTYGQLFEKYVLNGKKIENLYDSNYTEEDLRKDYKKYEHLLR